MGETSCCSSSAVAAPGAVQAASPPDSHSASERVSSWAAVFVPRVVAQQRWAALKAPAPAAHRGANTHSSRARLKRTS